MTFVLLSQSSPTHPLSNLPLGGLGTLFFHHVEWWWKRWPEFVSSPKCVHYVLIRWILSGKTICSRFLLDSSAVLPFVDFSTNDRRHPHNAELITVSHEDACGLRPATSHQVWSNLESKLQRLAWYWEFSQMVLSNSIQSRLHWLFWYAALIQCSLAISVIHN